MCLPAIAAKPSVFLEDLTWPELAQAVQQGDTIAIVPIGGTEQSGPQLALGKHNFRVRFLAEKIAQKLGNAIVAPVIAYVPEGAIDPPTEHMKFPGTLSIPTPVFEATIEGAAASLKHAGFKTIVFIGDHGSYQSSETRVADKLNAKWKGQAAVLAARNYYFISQSSYVDALKAKGFSSSEIGTHAALADTALQMATHPQSVRTGKLDIDPAKAQSLGVYGGNPRHAEAGLGQLGVDLIVAGTVTAIQEFAAKN